MGLGRVKIAFQYFGDSSGKINEFVGGEARLSSNIYDLLKREGHDVQYVHWDQDDGFDLYLDAPWPACNSLKSKKHIHFSFAHYDPDRCQDMLKYSCPQGIVSHPYRVDVNKSLHYAQPNDPYRFVFLPMPFDDVYRPSLAVKPFNRVEITWATKFWSDPAFDSPEHSQHFYLVNAINTLQALVKLNQRVDFRMNFIMSEGIDQAHPRHDAPGLVAQLKDAHRLGRMGWTDLLQVMGRSKLNVPVGGLQASVLESIFGEAVPVLYSDTRYCEISKELCLLPSVKEASVSEIYEALETLWLDEKVYTRLWDFYQEMFKDHTREGFLRNFKETLEKVGL